MQRPSWRVELMRVAQGQEPADLVVTGGVLLDVYTGELLGDWIVAVKGERVAYVGPWLDGLVGSDTQVLDARGQVVVPGLVDAHTHLFGARYSPHAAIPHILAGGTTCVVTELSELAYVAGELGVRAALDALRGLPVKVYATLPPLAATAPHLERHAPSVDAYRELLRDPLVVGLGEVYWGNLVLREDRRLLELIELAHAVGKVVEGHAAGARGARLAAYAAAGVTSCHEPTTAEEVRERLRLGYHTMVREGKIRQELEAVAGLWRSADMDLHRLCLVTDSAGAREILEEGYMDAVVRKAVRLGVDPVAAVRAATLVPAERFRLDGEVGGLAPGRYADFSLVPDLREFHPTVVVSSGRVVARDGKPVVSVPPYRYPDELVRTLRLQLPPVEAYRVRAPVARGTVRVRVVEMVTHLVTREGEADVLVHDGWLVPDGDLCLVAVLDRQGDGAPFVGFVRGFGLRRGACATSMAWDSPLLLAVGKSPEDLQCALTRLVSLGGGVVVCAGGEVLAELAAPVAGVVSVDPLEEVARREVQVDQALRGLGAVGPRPSLTVDVLAGLAIPHFRVCDRGYVRVRDGAILGLWPDGA
ncbi:MAG: adenine deaminase C-terminal domain-containing protein [Armatimonadota bacterium]|nr:adenine deaminase C-terminal domain-containing protein [Armatimonadota bacterium]MDR5688663.1 adenine deaminase C-terminal domain-containing protein [Armatimonadota bacterium]MDR7390998.1 adenine deaminase C-terminal domain-containing protein [Armatimonadota bacterium]MDR7395622.1 adenine deaminase C-terminal domain-containing protein [Armatimonadota bacterium]MDR7431296.1 adenine deaminase C-terminal domain-containing protein [Armatimonadota bacterium]